MKKTILSILSFSLLLAACSAPENSESTEEMAETAPSLDKAWETDTTLITPESVIYDAQNDILYVSCIGAIPPDAKDGDGYIAKVSLDGKILENKWVTGMNGPKGMALSGDTLFVTDIDQLVAINTQDGSIISKTPVEGSSFLNDAATDTNGDILFTGTNSNTLFKSAGGKISAVVQDSLIGGLNGVYVDGDTKVLAGFGSGNIYTLKEGTLTLVADSLFGGDGVEKYGEGFMISNWNGEVYYVDSEWNKTKLLDTKDVKENAADIEVIADKNLMLVPAFLANKVVAYTIK
ncbi:PQQ-like beta-propeller repeat protein [Marinilongibacter aquaticus]|uniref:PQQ-like beta-propeller repeat protein n=1 Tax=Marinilongibacter aquaticus TaxID=2975157 RepID=UPI0021BDE7E1|nr:PQQ-like beta-propeller repeat protein [Marinilongibacter aquaticus]UBM60188.1 PQQ-like beta-propeller repeat protein [Marinilongibacter aquaticus]